MGVNLIHMRKHTYIDGGESHLHEKTHINSQNSKSSEKANLKRCGTASRSNSGTLELCWRRCWCWRNNGSECVPWRHYHHNQLLPLLTVPLWSTDEVKWTRMFKLHLSVSIIVLFDGVGCAAISIIFPCYFQHWVLPILIFPHCQIKKGVTDQR